MKQVVVSIRDSAAEVYGRVVVFPAKGAAVRSFADEVNRADKENAFYNHADDFEMYVIGEFEDSTGVITPCTPVVIARGKDLLVTNA